MISPRRGWRPPLRQFMGQKTGAHETEEASRTSAGDRISDAGRASGTGRRIPARSSSATAAQASSPAAFTCSRFFQRDDASVVVSTANPCTAAYRAARSSLKRKHAVQRAPLSPAHSQARAPPQAMRRGHSRHPPPRLRDIRSSGAAPTCEAHTPPAGLCWNC